LKLVVTKPVRLKLDKTFCRDFYDAELLSKTYTSKSQMIATNVVYKYNIILYCSGSNTGIQQK